MTAAFLIAGFIDLPIALTMLRFFGLFIIRLIADAFEYGLAPGIDDLVACSTILIITVGEEPTSRCNDLNHFSATGAQI